MLSRIASLVTKSTKVSFSELPGFSKRFGSSHHHPAAPPKGVPIEDIWTSEVSQRYEKQLTEFNHHASTNAWWIDFWGKFSFVLLGLVGADLIYVKLFVSHEQPGDIVMPHQRLRRRKFAWKDGDTPLFGGEPLNKVRD